MVGDTLIQFAVGHGSVIMVFLTLSNQPVDTLKAVSRINLTEIGHSMLFLR